MITEDFYFSKSSNISISGKMEINLYDTERSESMGSTSCDALDMGLFKEALIKSFISILVTKLSTK
jgi:hypothetical protein